jgi:hypothetical protein
MSCWIETFGPMFPVSILIFRDRDEPFAVCLAVRTTAHHRGVAFRRLSLNASGEAAAENTYVEFNYLPCLPGYEKLAAAQLASYAAGLEWDEFTLDGFAPGPAYEALLGELRDLECFEQHQPSHYVDLAALRASNSSFEALVGSVTRKHLRQYARAYTRLGPIRLAAADSVETALRMFDELAALNRARWAVRSRYAVFRSPRFVSFHRRLIERSMPDRSVQLLRLTAGERTVGLVYNLVQDNRVYFYQCGYDYSFDRRLSPGMLTLAHAIQRCLEAGFDSYEFLSGDEPYKRHLATGTRGLVWTIIRRPTLRNRVAGVARKGLALWARVVAVHARPDKT